MPWKTEIDRIVSRNVADGGKGGENPEPPRAYPHRVEVNLPIRSDGGRPIAASACFVGQSAAQRPAARLRASDPSKLNRNDISSFRDADR